MQETVINGRDWIHVWSRVTLRIEAETARLNQLDGAIGDGDHGVTMAIGTRALRQALEKLDGDITIDRVFLTAGHAFLSAAGGAVGPLIGTMLTDTGKAFAGRITFGAEETVWMLELMEQALIRIGKARLGDKTMLDALHPAVVAARVARGENMAEILRRAADAADAGARSTSEMVSRRGRSSRLGERTRGHEDPGANTIALILHGLSEEVAAL
jgi:phosphoenolpyruvate---glycerone phosphotransferase subunit DhaL